MRKGADHSASQSVTQGWRDQPGKEAEFMRKSADFYEVVD